jgi:hypothetical protein
MSMRQTLAHVLAAGGARVLRSRRLMRAPIWIFRARLGFLFGTRLLMLEHIGRKTGLPREVVLEVFDHSTPGHLHRHVRIRRARPMVSRRAGEPAHPRLRRGARSGTRNRARTRSGGSRSRAGGLPAQARPGVGELQTRRRKTLGIRISDTHTALPMVELKLDTT